MRIITLNANGIRAAARKGFFDWLPAQNADFVCIQETKAQLPQLMRIESISRTGSISALFPDFQGYPEPCQAAP